MNMSSIIFRFPTESNIDGVWILFLKYNLFSVSIDAMSFNSEKRNSDGHII